MTTNGVLVWAVSLNGTDGREARLPAWCSTPTAFFMERRNSAAPTAFPAEASGTVFAITTNGRLTSLYSFTGGPDGAFPQAGLVMGPDGGLYGITTSGGNTALNAGLGFGACL